VPARSLLLLEWTSPISPSEQATIPRLPRRLKILRILCKQLNKEIRTTSYLLHPPLLDESGLSQAIQWYIEGFKGT